MRACVMAPHAGCVLRDDLVVLSRVDALVCQMACAMCAGCMQGVRDVPCMHTMRSMGCADSVRMQWCGMFLQVSLSTMRQLGMVCMVGACSCEVGVSCDLCHMLRGDMEERVLPEHDSIQCHH